VRRADLSIVAVLMAVVVGLAALSGCERSGAGIGDGTRQGGALPGGAEPDGVSYSRKIEPLLGKRCGTCHTADDPDGKLVLDPGKGYEQMVGRASTQAPALAIVAPGDVAGSYLWQKLENTSTIGRGMPRTLFGSRKLPESERELIRRWIEEGARP